LNFKFKNTVKPQLIDLYHATFAQSDLDLGSQYFRNVGILDILSEKQIAPQNIQHYTTFFLNKNSAKFNFHSFNLQQAAKQRA
jgi:hypothetical protein